MLNQEQPGPVREQACPEGWVDKYGDYLYRFALVRVDSPEAAEDLVQETFLAALKAAPSFAGRSSERTWLTGILKNKMVDRLRQAQGARLVADLGGAMNVWTSSTTGRATGRRGPGSGTGSLPQRWNDRNSWKPSSTALPICLTGCVKSFPCGSWTPCPRWRFVRFWAFPRRTYGLYCIGRGSGSGAVLSDRLRSTGRRGMTMVSCKRAGELVSRSFETKLSMRQRLALAVHLCGCRWCRRFQRQLRQVEQACRVWARSDRTTEAAPGAALTREARERIRRALRQAFSEYSG